MTTNEPSISSIIPSLKADINSMSNSVIGPSYSYSSGSDFPSSLWDNVKSMGVVGWLIVILILAFLGVNVFAYLAKGTQEVTGTVSPIVHFFSNIVRAITGQTLTVSAEGGKAVVNATADIANTGLNDVQKIGEIITPSNATSSLPDSSVLTNQTQQDNSYNNAINRVLNSAKAREQEQLNQEYQADEANSAIQGGGKGGWCYIGEDRGFRSCAPVSSSNMCMSGEIFPSQEVCVNPNLRH